MGDNCQHRTMYTKARGRYVYDKHGTIDTTSVFSHFTFGKVATCVDNAHEMFMQEGKVLNRRFNASSQHVLLSFQKKKEKTDAKKESETVKLVWFDIELVVCAVKDGRFYKVTQKEPDFVDCMIVCGNHPLNGYCFQVITTKGEGSNERTLFYDAGAKKIMYAPRRWAHTIEYEHL